MSHEEEEEELEPRKWVERDVSAPPLCPRCPHPFHPPAQCDECACVVDPE